MSLPADGVNANTLAETTTIPTGKKLIFLDPDTNEGGIITLENLTKQILSNLTSQTFNLDQGNKTLLAALNELNSKSSECIIVQANTERTKELKDNSLYIIVYSGINNGDINSDDSMHYAFVLTRQNAGRIGGIYNDSTVKTNIFSLDNNILKISTNSFWTRLHIRKL